MGKAKRFLVRNEDELKDIAQARRDAGVPPLKAGTKKCCICSTDFYTIDKAGSCYCNGCSANVSRMGSSLGDRL